ncbi:RNA polymerase sigma factor [Streptomyces acidicola]|uniref:RNA polymerase sigma factor n=1 Tax=Streptomyces acidicola TaxID=2596892 RepID=UPI00382E720B
MNQVLADEGDHQQSALERQQIEDFYMQEQRKLWNFVARRIGEDQAEDVCQESWRSLVLWLRRCQPKLDKELGAMLFHTAELRIADFCKRNKRVPPPAAGEDLVALESARDEYPLVDRRIDLKRALADLTDRQREALHLLYVDRLSVSETAVLMGITPDGVKNHKKRALNKLRSAPALASYGSTVLAKLRKVAN